MDMHAGTGKMLFSKIANLINREINEQNEPKETAVLIRVLCLVDIFYLSINAILSTIQFGAKIGLIDFALLIPLVITFIRSYSIKMSSLIYLYYFSAAFNLVVLVLLMGLEFMFQMHFCVLFMMFFYRAAGKKSERIISVFVSGIIMVSLTFYIRGHGALLDIDLSRAQFFTFFCSAYIFTVSAVIAYYFRKKFSASEEKIIRYSKKLEMLATTDPLTKLQNRRGMLKHIEEYTCEIGTNDKLLTVAIGDIDFFKKINDTYGHEAGDYVLETLAKIMNEFMENKGMVARWGGEEFLFTFEGINGDYAFEEMTRLLNLIDKYEFSYEGTLISVTMTFGVEEYDDGIGVDRVIGKADEKLYMGKEQGRNRVIY